MRIEQEQDGLEQYDGFQPKIIRNTEFLRQNLIQYPTFTSEEMLGTSDAGQEVILQPNEIIEIRNPKQDKESNTDLLSILA